MAVSAFRTEVPGDCMPRPWFTRTKFCVQEPSACLICASYGDKVCDTNVYTRDMQKLDVMP